MVAGVCTITHQELLDDETLLREVLAVLKARHDANAPDDDGFTDMGGGRRRKVIAADSSEKWED